MSTPQTPNPSSKYTRLEIKLPEDMKNKLEEISQKAEISQSEILRKLISMFVNISEIKDKREAKITVVAKVLEIIETLFKRMGIPSERELEIVSSKARQDYDGQVPYDYALIYRNGECKYLMRQSNMEWEVTREKLATALLEDHNWDIVSVISVIMYCIEGIQR